jgi:uncharacterized protein (TIGR00297 family)
VVVGSLVLAAAGWAGGAALAAFFISASAVSRLDPATPSALDVKGHRRDHWQVFANGGAAAFGAAGAALAGQRDLALWIAVGSLASAAADTWATSIGGRSRKPPVHLLSGRVVPAGTSGGITATGTAGAAAGAAITAIAAAGVAATTGASQVTALAAGGIIMGVGGMLADSALGASVQGRFHCPACDVPSEWPRHRCGAPTARTGGWQWLTNDGVNMLATALAASGAGAAWWLVSR